MFSKNQSKDSIALVLVTYNRSVLLSEALISISNMTCLPNAIFIIDNKSTDDTACVVDLFIKEHPWMNVEYYNTGYNAGGAGGFRIGCKLAWDAGYEYIWLADDDIEVDKYCLEKAFPHLCPDTIIQPMRFNISDNTCAEISAVVYDLKNPFYLRPKRKTVADIYSSEVPEYEILSIPFEGPIVHRSVFDKIGFPEEAFFIFNDDLDFALKATANNISIKCITASKIYRKIPFTQSVALKTWKGYFMFRNYFRIQKIYGVKPFIYIRIFSVFTIALLHCILRLDFSGAVMLIDAFNDGMSKTFQLNKKYLPN
ncbi:glycosyltransferase [Scandinavium goeteborgense]|uniref:glycosyltransferase n=1 Tax=Scandinavium goeteborgense TaxID=1851514 RepID=UPI00381347DE